jgi:hypothetical protein
MLDSGFSAHIDAASLLLRFFSTKLLLKCDSMLAFGQAWRISL